MVRTLWSVLVVPLYTEDARLHYNRPLGGLSYRDQLS